MIPMVNLKAQYAEIKEEIEQGLAQTIESCSFILGPNVQAFEKEAAEYLGVKHAIGVASGTDALHLALLAEGIGEGDEVITTAFTFIATAEAIRYVGAKPVFVDVDPKTFNITAATIEAAITDKTTAVMPVHLFGQPVDMAAIKVVCDKHNLKLIEDCAQSFGASIAGKQTGSIGNAAGYSFFPSKNLGAFGDGGLVGTNSDETAEMVRQLRNHGSKVRYYHDVIGFNSRLDDMQSVVLRAKLKRIDRYNASRRHAAHLYSELMADLPIETPFEDGIGVHVYHQYTLLSDRRDEILEALQAKQISCSIFYPVPLHQQNVFKEDCAGLSLPATEAIAARCMSLPICSEISDESIKEIVAVIRSVFAG
ncbi:MAG: DegT/DnrJ/EryC1/StrS family aminotransferase [Gammaproteobacteria bacterium]|jgi:dTDP-4-amino-4,6-dideoxygalactose transaminase|nr:DegT/DnrJ/EryC1/StrS family aminotransferase [Gammaproteobacteria bacterium]MBT4146381.1 DegT/DnrJ/EryC1/StrS family aminotransferase [Gammaproteobacteria bacterium]MBT5222700.1 DegT/DnrJ/EryC1/StrS family aminotransferase [Gammaproteobacteria bacterium]MBT5825714.1 DegT/DnrJ/EryC1/StrS family aminotransferase [Gammaproteobacteria bacterium]MBT6421067.1 DegT/DnrJ/EryC1/StrS family aminotransferase [Gammaproteobacteria bacterium]